MLFTVNVGECDEEPARGEAALARAVGDDKDSKVEVDTPNAPRADDGDTNAVPRIGPEEAAAAAFKVTDGDKGAEEDET
jgi:hypothetical protein